jgi:hypothetical protein
MSQYRIHQKLQQWFLGSVVVFDLGSVVMFGRRDPNPGLGLLAMVFHHPT